MFHKIKPTLALLFVLLGVFFVASPLTASALTSTCADGSTAEGPTQEAMTAICQQRAQNAATTPGRNEPENANFQGECNNAVLDKTNCGILAYLITAINVLSAVVGVVVVIMIAVGGIQYSAAKDNPQATVAAKSRITNAIIALVAYIFMWAFLQYIIPGGVL